MDRSRTAGAAVVSLLNALKCVYIAGTSVTDNLIVRLNVKLHEMIGITSTSLPIAP